MRAPFPEAEIGAKTAADYGVAHGDDVIVETDRGWVKMKARVDEEDGPGREDAGGQVIVGCNACDMASYVWNGLLLHFARLKIPGMQNKSQEQS